MKKLILLLSMWLYAALAAYGTSVTGQLRDANGQVLAFSGYTVQFVGPGNASVGGNPFPRGPFAGVTDGSGNFAVTLTDNSTIQPAGTMWRFTFSPPATVQSQEFSLGIAGTTQNITSSVILAPLVVSPTNMNKAYTDAEINGPGNGAFYYNLSTNTARLYSSGIWGDFGTGGGGGGSGTVTGGLQYSIASYPNVGTNSVVGPDPFLASNTTGFFDTHPGGITSANGFYSTSAAVGVLTLNIPATSQSFSISGNPSSLTTWGVDFPFSDGGGPLRLSGTIGGDGRDQTTVGLNPNDVVSAVNTQAGTTYAIQNTDQGVFVALTNAGSVAVSLPDDSSFGFGADWFAIIAYEGAASATITPSTSTLCGGSSFILSPGQSITIYGDGINYHCAKGVGGGGGSLPGTAGQMIASNGSGGGTAVSNFTCSGGNCQLGTSSAGIFSVFQINSLQSCTLGNGYMNMCRGDALSWAAWNGTNFDTFAITTTDRALWSSAQLINGAGINTFAFLSDLNNFIANFNGDGTLITNSNSHGPTTTVTLGNAPAYRVWGNNTGSTGAPGYVALNCGMLSANASSGTPSSSTVCYGDGVWRTVSAGGGNVTGTGTTVVNSVSVWNNTGATALIDAGAMTLPDNHTWQGSLTTSSSNQLTIQSNPPLVLTVAGTMKGTLLAGNPIGSGSSSGINTGIDSFIIMPGTNAAPIASGFTTTGQSVIIGGGPVTGSIGSNGNTVPGNASILISGRLTTGTVPGSFSPACWGGSDEVGLTGHNTLQACGSATAQENFAGVVLPTSGSYSPTMGHTFYANSLGKNTVQSNTSQSWTAGDTLCTDPTNAGFFIDAGAAPARCMCPSTQAGVITSTETGTFHIVQLTAGGGACVPEAQVAGVDVTNQNLQNFAKAGTNNTFFSITNPSGGTVQFNLSGSGSTTKVATTSVSGSAGSGNAASWTSGGDLLDSGLKNIGVIYDSTDQTYAMSGATTTGCLGGSGTTIIGSVAANQPYSCKLYYSQTVASTCTTQPVVGGQLQYTDVFTGLAVNGTLGAGGNTNMLYFKGDGSAVVGTSFTAQTSVAIAQVATPIPRSFYAASGSSIAWCLNVATAPTCTVYPTFKARMRCEQD